MRLSRVLAVVCGALALLCLAAVGLFFVERPTVITVAIPVGSTSDRDLLAAAGKVVRHGRQPIRFKIVTTPDEQSAAQGLDDGKVDMAVIRSDGVLPANGQTVVILHRDAAVLVAPGSSDLKSIADLAGHTVGIIESFRANDGLLATILEESDVPAEAVKTVPLTVEAVAESIKTKTVDAVLAVGIVSGSQLQSTVRAVAQADDSPPVFLEVKEAEAIAQRSPAYEKASILKGAFKGKPPRPDDDLDTVSVTHRLLASSALSQTAVADVTRFFLSERSALVAADPMARAIEEPSTDKGAALPAHAGSAAYIDDEEESFLDQYSDFFYLGAMMIGVLASGATAIFGRLNAQGVRAVDQLTARLVEILKLVRFAPSLERVKGLETETDDIVAAALEDKTARSLDERRLGALALALDQVREAIRDRRLVLGTDPSRPTQPEFVPVD